MSRIIPAPQWRLFTLLAAVSALCAAPIARASITPEAKAVIDRYLEASGGRARNEAVTSSWTRMKLEAFGFTGIAEAWEVAPNQDATVIDLGPFHIEDAYDGTRGWRLDQGGKLLLLDGKDLVDAAAGAWFSNDGWAASDQRGGRVTLVGTEKDSTGSYAVLEAAPPTGRSRQLWFDDATGLMARTVTAGDVQTVITTNSDWRVIDGFKVPTRVLQTVAGMPANTLVQILDTMAVNVPVPPERFMAPGERPAAVKWFKRPGVAAVPFEYRGRHVWVRAAVDGGPPADFIVDTGASMTVLDSAYAASIGLTTEGAMAGQGASATGHVAFAHLKSLSVSAPDGDGLEMQDLKVGVLSINALLAPFFWRDCAGIIGFNLLSRFVDRIDYDARVLTFYEPKSYTHSGAGAKVPFRLAGFIPVVPMTVDGRYSGEFRIDVGSSSTVDLHTPFVKRHGLLAKAKPSIEVMGGGFGGTFSSRMTRMRSMTLGPFTWKQPLVTLSTGETGMLASEDYAGNIGNQILDRFTVTFDYDRRELWLEPGASAQKRDRFSRLGAQLMRLDGVIKVGQLLPGSPAERAGMRELDEVVTIDGKPSLDYGPDAINRMFEEEPAGARHTFEVRRAGGLVTLTATLKDIL